MDTCVLLHDPNVIHRFPEHDLYLPLAVIDDLDDIKTRKESSGWAAREVFRQLAVFLADITEVTEKGVTRTAEGGKLFIHNHEPAPQKGLSPNISRSHSDNAIINTAHELKSRFPRRTVTVVTRDAALRVRATAWGCRVEDYDVSVGDEAAFTGMRGIEVSDKCDWDALWRDAVIDPATLSLGLRDAIGTTSPNEFIIFEQGSVKCPTMVRGGMLKVLKDKSNGLGGGKVQYMGVSAKNLEQRCALEALADDSIPLVTLSGSAGTGKTLLSLAVMLEKVDMGVYDRIIVIKPLIAVGGKDIGALPGDKFEKIAAWLGPIRDNIAQLVTNRGADRKAASESFEEMVEAGLVEVEAMSFIQGRSITNSVVILDEAQNLSEREARMAVERIGKGSKIVLLGDPSQVENHQLDRRNNGLARALRGGKTLEVAASVTLTHVERSPLAAAASVIFGNQHGQN
jgi:PhoH-like ATPase